MLYQTKNTAKTIGAKQSLKALEEDAVKCLLVAKDADVRITNNIVELAKAKNVQVEYIDTMKELGIICNVEVKTAVAAIIN